MPRGQGRCNTSMAVKGIVSDRIRSDRAAQYRGEGFFEHFKAIFQIEHIHTSKIKTKQNVALRLQFAKRRTGKIYEYDKCPNVRISNNLNVKNRKTNGMHNLWPQKSSKEEKY